ncbi:related to Heat shock protein Hsp20 [Pseudozyma flocculosa]|uniref:Related to Heat shock protein Hsp20 n=2 Tax=Pseudozyma flocculosa TaxID=84751 RepID=A0A5C3F345_9BASI|nr:related to Heat shock protein Hsp20 [Pseudozyma flocculosa]
MSLFRSSPLFGFPDFDTFPSFFGGGGLRSSGFPSSLLTSGGGPASDFFRNDNMWSGPRIDVHETERSYEVVAELPGCKREDIRVSSDPDRRRLTIEGQIRSEYSSGTAAPAPAAAGAEGEGQAKEATTAPAAKTEQAREVATQSATEGRLATPLVQERVFGSFSRSFTLPTNANLADDKALKARFQDGLLKLEIPKKSEEISKTRQITIE